MKWINIKILSQKIIKNPLFLAFLAMLILEYGAYRVFSGKENVPILAAISTGLVVMFGYFATHYFTIIRNQRERKFEQCLELIKKIRFFILEDHTKETGNEGIQGKMRDELQDAYFAFSLLTSAESYEALSKMMDAFKALLTDPGHLCEFQKAQNTFVNILRREFFTDREIEFKTYDFRLHTKPTKTSS